MGFTGHHRLNMARATPGETRKSRILLVDDHPIVLIGLTELINQKRDMVVCGKAESAEAALQAIPSIHPDLVIVDLSLQGTGGLELIKDLKIRHPKLPVLVLSMHEESLYAERVLRAGARGYIMKREVRTQLEIAIRRTVSGKIYLSQRMSEQLLELVAGPAQANKGPPLEQLSDREVEVFEMIGRGKGTTEIAKLLHLSVKTIEGYRANIKTKLGLKSALELIRYSLQCYPKT
jgi:DNA-binding NarL/FixJ family response regulator